jgi:DNA-binding beta-propeller fold protein YncE
MRCLPLCALLAATLACEQTSLERFSGEAWPAREGALPRPAGAGPLALVTDNGSDTLSLVDLASMQTMARVPIGIHPIENDGPHHLAVDPAAGAVFTAFSYPPPAAAPGPHASHGTAQTYGTLVRLGLDDLRIRARAGTDLNPGDVKLTPDGKRVLVTHFDLTLAARATGPGGEDERRSTLLVFDAETLARVGGARVGMAAHGLTVSADGRKAFVACYGSDELAVVTLDDPAFPVTRVPVGPSPGSGSSLQYGPYGALLSPDGATVYVHSLESRDVRAFDVAAGAFDPARVAPVRGAAFFPALGPDAATLIVPVQSPDGLVLLDRATFAVRKARSFTRAECQRPHEAARTPDGRYVLVCEGDRTAPGALVEIDPESLDLLARTELGVYPDAIGFVPAGAR